MEYLKLTLTYIVVATIFDIRLFVKGVKTKEFSDLKYRVRAQVCYIIGILLATFILSYLLKIDTKIFEKTKVITLAIVVNIVFLFTKKKQNVS
ncbi:hypothetical protein ACTNDY_12875 [Tissierellaceae bacterium HCP3S3_D8]